MQYCADLSDAEKGALHEKNNTLKRLPESELKIMQIIWRKPAPVSRTTIEHALKDSHPLAPTTILTLLTRLCDKGFLSLKKEGRTNLYYPLVAEKEYLAAESQSFLDRLFGGSVAGFATALCDSGIKKEELEELKKSLKRRSRSNERYHSVLPVSDFLGIISWLYAGILFPKILEHRTRQEKPSPDAPGNGIVILQDPLTLPFLCIVYIFLLVLLYGMDASGYVFSFGFDLFCFITVYFPLLLFLLPFLRNRYTARTYCHSLADTGISVLSAHLHIPGFSSADAACLLHSAAGSNLAFFVWLTGFAITLLLQILSHLYFYRTLKISSHPVSDPHLLQLWEEMTRDIGIYDLTHPLRLCYSSRIHTPLSIGMCQRSLITCLPERSFDKEEAELIFSHELHHIQRHDTHTKFFSVYAAPLAGSIRSCGWQFEKQRMIWNYPAMKSS